MFSGEAYNVEIGVTNDLFGNERETDPNCQLNATPESASPLTVDVSTGSPAADFSSDIVLFATFMRLLAAPSPAGTTTTPVAAAATSQVASASSVLPSASGTTATSTTTTTTASATSIARGKTVFGNVGCSACHSGSLKTGKSPIAALSEKTFEPLSDFAVHNMGGGLADGVSQGGANGNEFRTAPLWGVGQRVFFLHDGRTNNIVEAIQEHASRGSEANTVINNFNLLPRSDKQALVDYLRSL
jgi:cytochrome c peroxidase